MTSKPKARRFRVKRPNPKPQVPPESQTEATETRATPSDVRPEDALQDNQTSPDHAATDSAATDPPIADGNSSDKADMDRIRDEALTGRQLRMARRLAQKHDIVATSDYEAVRLLREAGIDPFKRSSMLELVVPETAKQISSDTSQARAPARDDAQPDAHTDDSARQRRGIGKLLGTQLPQTTSQTEAGLPGEALSPSQRRALEIAAIQRQIAQRRRRKLALLMTRLAFFVFLPTIIAGYYFFAVATPMYATKSEFLIIQNEGSGASGGLGGLLPTQFATGQDSIAVQGYLQSKDAMLRLDRDLGFRAHFQEPSIDPIQRLSEDATNDDAYSTFQQRVKIGFDPTEGVIRMEVVATNPETSAEFARRLIDYAEERVNALSAQKRDDQMADARSGFELAQSQRRAAQEALVRLQLEGATLDPEGVIAGLRAQINQVELQLIEKELQLQALLDNPRPNAARVEGAEGDISRLRDQLEKLNQRMTDASEGENSLAQLSVRIQMAQADLATRDMMLQSALQQMEQARMEANRQVRYLTVSVNPVPSDEPSYPRSFENTILAFLIFAGIYLMLSLTASILREQVSS